jgi:orotidine-5'-phosphate decarboxylase
MRRGAARSTAQVLKTERGLKFADKLARGWSVSAGHLCIGLDPLLERMPRAFARELRPALAFGRHVVDLVGDLACAFKPQFAHYAALGAETDLAELISYIHQTQPHAVVILDAKRGDIGSTAERYAQEAFVRHDADAVTVNPFMGDESVLPFLEKPDRGAVILCRTTNPDAGRYQHAMAASEPVFQAIARRAETVWNIRGNAMLVVGAADLKDMALARAAAPTLPFLVPGIGEQGGSAAEAMAAGARLCGGAGLVVSASRSILYAGSDAGIRAAAEAAHRDLAA